MTITKATKAAGAISADDLREHNSSSGGLKCSKATQPSPNCPAIGSDVAPSVITKRSWRDVLPAHPAADIFPMMPFDELIALGEDIKKNGLRNRVAVIEGPDNEPMVIDGRNRLDAMELVGIEIVIEDVALKINCGKCRKNSPGFNAYDYVVSANIHRRHLTAEQKRDVIAKLLKATPGKSNRQIAEQVKADHKTVGSVRDNLKATGEIPQLETTTGKDGKARKQPIKRKRAIQPKQKDSSRSGVSEVPTTPEKRISGLPMGSLSQKILATQAAVAETRAQPANPIIAAWEALTTNLHQKDSATIVAVLEQLEEFSRDHHGEAVVDMFMRHRRSDDDPLKYRIYKICDAIEIELGDEEGDYFSEEIADLRTEYKAAAEALEDLEQRISDARADEEEEEEEEEPEAAS